MIFLLIVLVVIAAAVLWRHRAPAVEMDPFTDDLRAIGRLIEGSR